VKLRQVFSFIRPFAAIARELRIIRELYELDLESREKPIYRITEKPSKKDTEVSYSGVADTRPGFKRWFESGEEEDDVQS
jgi:hypothetical protein